MPDSRAFILEDVGFDGLHLRSRQVPKPEASQVLVKMQAASLNFRDLKIVKGTYARKPTLPVVLLSDGAGDVISTGACVTRFTSGDRVMPIYMSGWHRGPLSDRHAGWKGLGGDVDGTATEYALVHEDDLVSIPDNLSYAEAACIPCAGVTAWHALVCGGGVKAGDDVLIMGSGGVSLASLQIALMSGARAIAISSSDEKVDRLRKMGAAYGINYSTTDDWSQAVLDYTEGRGVDQVVEVVGRPTMARSIHATKDGGHIAVVGDLGGGLSDIEAPERKINMTRVTVGSRQMTEDLLRAIALHGEKPVIDRTYLFEDLKDALKHLEVGEHFGKVVLEF